MPGQLFESDTTMLLFKEIGRKTIGEALTAR